MSRNCPAGDNDKEQPEPCFLAIVPDSLKRLRNKRTDCLEMFIPSSKAKNSTILYIL